MNDNQFLLEKQSMFNFDRTVEILTNEALKSNWNVPAIHDLQQSLAKSGKHVKPVKVLEICKPQYSGQMLELNDERIISVMMPCRISVYEKDDGKTYVALLDPSPMAAGLPANISRVMREAAEDTFRLLKSVVTEPVVA
jgi:uncharacterized protein (DUF302 family)